MKVADMPDTEKIIDKMKQAPDTIRPEELNKVLEAKGFYFNRQRGSHKVYVNQENGEIVVIPQNNPIKEYYIKDVLKRIGE